MLNKQNVHCHGDITLYPAKAKPPAKAEKAKLHVLQASDVTKNRHEVVNEKYPISRWSDKTGKNFIACPKPFRIQHVGGDSEHGVQEVAVGTYEVRHEMEYDPWKNELRIVLD